MISPRFLVTLTVLVNIYFVGCTDPAHKRLPQTKSPICQQCKKTIDGEYIVALNRAWHPQHFRCSTCNKPLVGSRFFEKANKPYCQDCYNKKFSPLCDVCHLPLNAKYTRDAWGFNFHSHHLKELEPCFSCARLVCKNITNGGKKYNDGRLICNICLQSSVSSPAQAANYFGNVKSFMTRKGLVLPNDKFPLQLVDMTTLRKSSPHFKDVAGRTEKALFEVNGIEKARRIEKIQILDGLPAEHFVTIAAHEFGHAWLFLNNYPELDLQVEEGICELFEYLWLSEQKTEIARFRIKKMMETKDKIYGGGFRKALAAYKKHGLKKMLYIVKSRKNF
ncbi:MAG: protein DA1 [Deferribacteres bacterium]|nr:protein DA1 [candidate division KSB1 bacterium]MCB9503040.1 protein DA1 [Deferribacteres bacterium]